MPRKRALKIPATTLKILRKDKGMETTSESRETNGHLRNGQADKVFCRKAVQKAFICFTSHYVTAVLKLFYIRQDRVLRGWELRARVLRPRLQPALPQQPNQLRSPQLSQYDKAIL